MEDYEDPLALKFLLQITLLKGPPTTVTIQHV